MCYHVCMILFCWRFFPHYHRCRQRQRQRRQTTTPFRIKAKQFFVLGISISRIDIFIHTYYILYIEFVCDLCFIFVLFCFFFVRFDSLHFVPSLNRDIRCHKSASWERKRWSKAKKVKKTYTNVSARVSVCIFMSEATTIWRKILLSM